ncbi:hypothetical protein MPSEU_000061100 [Mayamaea pseudoterrestris]|nr:hypothetical protein MPSEU_000061100 [Mayamaea pseudoterrestris]
MKLLSLFVMAASRSSCHALSMTSSAVTRAAPAAASTTKSFNQRALSELPPFPRTWVPLGSTFEMDGSRPNKVEFLGQSYVCYQSDVNDKNSWAVVDDACSHRLAPLSEGRVITTEADTGNEIKIKDLKKNKQHGETRRLLECAYHGWAFDANGKCTRIPQATLELQERTIRNNPKCHVQGYSTRVSKNILFAWLWPEDCLEYINDKWRQPEYWTKDMLENVNTYTRDSQYGWDTLLENIVDQSHIPWVHHGLQGTRDDSSIMNMTVIGSSTEQGMDFTFQDRTKAYERRGVIQFKAPCHMSLSAQRKPNGKNDWEHFFTMNLFAIPTKPGYSRLISTVGSAKPMNASMFGEEEAAPTAVKPRRSLFIAIFRRIPRWMAHQFTNRIVDSDVITLHKQEQERAKRGVDYENYCMPASSDRCIAPIRRWVLKHAHIPSLSTRSDDGGATAGRVVIPEPPSQRSALFDRWAQHSDQCKHCHGAFDGIQKWRRNNFLVMAASILLARHMAARVVLVGSFAMWRLLQAAEKSITTGECDHYKNH